MKIYTRTGDQGTTGLIGGTRVSKDDPRIDSYGLVDELNAVLGMVRAAHPPADTDAEIARIQDDLFVLGADLADPRPPAKGQMRVDPARATAIEKWIDTMEATLAPLRNFILPGGSPAGAALHLARTVARRAERAVVALAKSHANCENAVIYLNRLADALFVAARYANRIAGVPEVEWRPSK
ncbi:MAG: cob(I)yrinic acid a,c-diamide adenosyltransferase [Planctomycetes bacterium]|nr:cob(I)yrinic acid a,c-diamide adenosyltransferase [Planctomycetota bacterium]